MDNLDNLCECPACLEILRGKIYICNKGHSFCEGCSKNLQKCALCQGGMTTQRNLLMENAISEILKIKSNPNLRNLLNQKDFTCNSCIKFMNSSIYVGEDGCKYCQVCWSGSKNKIKSVTEKLPHFQKIKTEDGKINGGDITTCPVSSCKCTFSRHFLLPHIFLEHSKLIRNVTRRKRSYTLQVKHKNHTGVYFLNFCKKLFTLYYTFTIDTEKVFLELVPVEYKDSKKLDFFIKNAWFNNSSRLHLFDIHFNLIF
ncbi:unnamed protein product [Brassicogethes aeneus]|uniref:E3 ubiquitin-protein ligase Sina-like RING finger domain-containing protein n=1 Tax=Brassicogethes aeneus TaxID=1431903 RepID=A0A9P0BKA3_BRAAE|nr:unnamed protein product [Brassicogethes aeneus]